MFFRTKKNHCESAKILAKLSEMRRQVDTMRLGVQSGKTFEPSLKLSKVLEKNTTAWPPPGQADPTDKNLYMEKA